jgi:hypothetical protein
VFVQTDNTAGNRVVAYDRAADGNLAPAGSYATGGRGGILAGSVVDHTASQGSLASDPRHGLLYAVNAGSDTISVFAVRGDRLALRQVLGSGGTFPVSVAVHGDLVYVLNAAPRPQPAQAAVRGRVPGGAMNLLRRRDLVCQQAVELVTDYLEGTLTGRARRRFEAHLAGCPHCTEYLAQMRETISLTGRLEPEDLTPQMRDEFTDLYRRWRSEQQ